MKAKRLMDVVGALVLLVMGAPLLALAALAVRATMGSPVLYPQVRAGLDGMPFTLWKLRTMRDPRGVGGDGAAGEDGDRLTRLGRWLRALSLDELPQVWNVLRGEMSLVGPRPLLPRYLPRYTAEQRRRHAVPPGLTGLVQVSGRNALDWSEKLSLDVWYVDHRRLALDVWILCRTPWAVLRGRGVSARGHATMPEFQGDGRANMREVAS